MQTKLKICGIRSYDELDDLKELDIDYFGAIFAKKSPRVVSKGLAKKNSLLAHKHNKKVVGVFVETSVDDIFNTVIETNIDVVQLHSNESCEFVKKLYNKLNTKEITDSIGKKVPIWKVFQVEDNLPEFDNFKKYNDRYGHVEGDACLRKVAQCIQDSLKRPIDFCARYGGEEFVVILPNSSLDGAMIVAERIRENVENMNIEHLESTTGGIVTISLGLVTSKIINADSDGQLIRCADQALYLAKKFGRNQVRNFAADDEKLV